MKLIEKKCPNCGASLEFSETAKSCKCEYCHRAFEIERDNNLDVSDIAEQFNLNELATPAKPAFAIFGIGAILLIVVSIVFFGFIFSSFNESRKSIEKSINNQWNDIQTNAIATNISDLSNTTLKDFSKKAYSELDVKGEHSNKYSFNIEDDEVYKYILASKGNTNYLYVVEKALYINFFNANEKASAFVPVKFENVTKEIDTLSEEGEEILNSISVDAPTFYLNSTKSSYIRGGYADYNKFVEEKINPLKDQGYLITEK